MIRRYLFTVIWLLTVFNAALALKCYACEGSKTSDCAKGKVSSMVTQFCPNVSSIINDDKSWYKSYSHSLNELDESNVQVVCLKLLISGFQPLVVARACGIVPANIDPCTYMKHIKSVEDCKSCKTDLCNTKSNDEYDPVVNMII
ncbi:hypothetical protein ILUMI_19973 [Ignelater luminosus]|uniref:Protein sleepless n=1 Tax=Ignelater luminosus TaxID=2038154 RepID=A0A8K0G526_IGNLU|nr:hypothetical protein ILUMI_19973 [Ignelater luminosus]